MFTEFFRLGQYFPFKSIEQTNDFTIIRYAYYSRVFFGIVLLYSTFLVHTYFRYYSHVYWSSIIDYIRNYNYCSEYLSIERHGYIVFVLIKKAIIFDLVFTSVVLPHKLSSLYQMDQNLSLSKQKTKAKRKLLLLTTKIQFIHKKINYIMNRFMICYLYCAELVMYNLFLLIADHWRRN